MHRCLGYIELPEHLGKGGFDHADVHYGRGQLYVAHTVNDSVDVIDTRRGRYSHSIVGLKGVAGVLVSVDRDLVCTSNRGGNAVAFFHPERENDVVAIPVGVRPNGLAHDSARNILLSANIGDPERQVLPTISLVDVDSCTLIADMPLPGRPRWAVFDPNSAAFYVAVSSPAQIVVIPSQSPWRVARHIDVPVAGPHGLDIDTSGNRLFCACDGGELVSLSLPGGEVLHRTPLSGVPDVVFYDPAVRHIYAAVGDPGTIDVIDSETLAPLATIETEGGAHTFALDKSTHLLYVFLPTTHRALVIQVTG